MARTSIGDHVVVDVPQEIRDLTGVPDCFVYEGIVVGHEISGKKRYPIVCLLENDWRVYGNPEELDS